MATTIKKSKYSSAIIGAATILLLFAIIAGTLLLRNTGPLSQFFTRAAINKCTSSIMLSCTMAGLACDANTGQCVSSKTKPKSTATVTPKSGNTTPASIACAEKGSRLKSGQTCCAGLVFDTKSRTCIIKAGSECVPGQQKKVDFAWYICNSKGKWILNTNLSPQNTGKPPSYVDDSATATDDGSDAGDPTESDLSSEFAQQNDNPCQQKKNQQSQQNQQNSQNQSSEDQSSSEDECDDKNCQNIRQGSNWGITNCSGDDPNGDIQLCDAKGRVGICREKEYCCPGGGQKWTTAMTSCPKTTTTVTVSPSEVSVGQSITVEYEGIYAPTNMDWLGMYASSNSDNKTQVDWNYVRSSGKCTKSEGDSKSKGSCTFSIAKNISPGTYLLRLFSSDTYMKLATSNEFEVLAGSSQIAGECCACPTPTPYYAQSSCNGSCMTSFNCPSGQVCLLADTYGWVCRNPACVTSPSCNCGSLPLTSTPTPSPTVRLLCGEECSTTAQCRTGYRCVFVQGIGTSVCRNTRCTSSESCLCPTPTPTILSKGASVNTPTPTATATPSGSVAMSLTPTPTGLRLQASPTDTPAPTPIPVNPGLAIKPFTDARGIASAKFTLTGTSDPFTEIEVRFDPEGIGQTTTSDAKGNWRYIVTKSLASGNHDLTVTARTDAGGETQAKQSFTVKKSGSFGSLFIGFLFLAAIAGIGYFIYKKQTSDQSALFSQFPPIEPSGTTPSSSTTIDMQEEKKSGDVFTEPVIESKPPGEPIYPEPEKE